MVNLKRSVTLPCVSVRVCVWSVSFRMRWQVFEDVWRKLRGLSYCEAFWFIREQMLNVLFNLPSDKHTEKIMLLHIFIHTQMPSEVIIHAGIQCKQKAHTSDTSFFFHFIRQTRCLTHTRTHFLLNTPPSSNLLCIHVKFKPSRMRPVSHMVIWNFYFTLSDRDDTWTCSKPAAQAALTELQLCHVSLENRFSDLVFSEMKYS